MTQFSLRPASFCQIVGISGRIERSALCSASRSENKTLTFERRSASLRLAASEKDEKIAQSRGNLHKFWANRS